ncbi:MAG: DoxX family protein [Actinobacteria bacterium]|nr:DoxX family protein [Actinomycetota bacterium]
MVPFIVLVVSLLVFRGLGALEVGLFDTWQEAASYALAVMLLLTASAHFTKTREDLAKMVPNAFPNPELLVAVTGVLELLGAVGLAIPATRSVAGVCLALLMAAMFPANVSAARRGVTFRSRPPTPLIARVPIQVVFVGFALWAALS